ncbi:MAG: M56 family metallopeptidase [Limisphaerales bacterium]
MIADLESLSFRICSALGNGVVQGLLLSGAALLGLRMCHFTSAATRYAAAFASLLTVAALPVVHFVLASAPASAVAGADHDHSQPSADPAWFESVHERPSDPSGSFATAGASWSGPYSGESPVDTIRRDSVHPQPRPTSSPTPAPGPVPTSPGSTLAPDLANPRTPSKTDLTLVEAWIPHESEVDRWRLEKGSDAENAGIAREPSSWFHEGWRTRWVAVDPFRLALHPGLAFGLAGVWMLLAGLRLVGLAWQCLVLQRIKRHRLPVSEALRDRFDSIRREMGVRRTIELGAVADLRSPMAVGFFRPAILLPDSLSACAPEKLDPVLRHELAHVQRLDDWTNLIQQGIRAVFFFHPGVLALSRRLTLDREIACDDHVLASSRAPRDYALFLTDFASRSNGRQWAAAPAAWSNPNQLRERIHMILDSKRNASPRIAPVRMGLLTLAALLIAATGIAAAPRLALEAPENPDVLPTEPPTPELAEADVNVNVDTDLEFDLLLAETDPSGRSLTISTDSEPPSDKPKRKPGRTVESNASGHSHSSTITIVSSEDGKPENRREIHRTVIMPAPAALPHPTPLPAAKPAPAKAPRPPKTASAGAAWSSDSSGASKALEDRMRRLEKMVESLVRSRSNPDLPELPPQPEVHFRFEGLAKDMEIAAKEFERAAREAGERIERFEWNHGPAAGDVIYGSRASGAEAEKRAIEVRRKVVESQRRALRQQIEQMQNQVERLERQLDRLENDFEAESEEADAKARIRKAEKEIEKMKEKEKEKSKDKSPESNADDKPGTRDSSAPRVF